MKVLDVKGFDEVQRIEVGNTVAFLALHAVIRGRTFGGIRIRKYKDESAALEDALDLARAMSRKVVMAGIEGGGAKTVMLQPSSDREAAVRDLGKHVESLQGKYVCGGDFGFTDEDQKVILEETKWVGCGALAPYTAQSVEIAMRAVLQPKVVAIQGLGAVGLPLAQSLKKAGVKVIAADVRPVEGFETVGPDEIYDVECDVFAPCAMGGVVNPDTIHRLKTRLVCGGANNPFSSDEDSDALHARGILYVPDFLSNAGATIHGASGIIGEKDRIPARMEAVGTLARELAERSRKEGRSSHRLAIELADSRIDELREG